MKKLFALALCFALAVCVLTGCGRKDSQTIDTTDAPTIMPTMPTTEQTNPTTSGTEPTTQGTSDPGNGNGGAGSANGGADNGLDGNMESRNARSRGQHPSVIDKNR